MKVKGQRTAHTRRGSRFWLDSIVGANFPPRRGHKRLISILQRDANSLFGRTFTFSNQKDADGGVQAAKPKTCMTGMFYWGVVSI